MAVDSYGMREISHPPGPGDMLYSSDPYSAGAAGIGVARARSVSHQPDYSPALKDGNAPYPAFAAPNPGHMPGGSGDPYAGTTLAGQNVEFLGAAGMGGHIGGALSHSQQYGGPYPQGSLEKNRGADGQYYRPNGYGPPGPAPAPTVPANRFSVVNEDVEDAYGGVTDGAVDHGEADRIDAQIASSLPNPFERDISEEGHAKDTDMESVHSGYSQEEEPKRILKVRIHFFLYLLKSHKLVPSRLQTNRFALLSFRFQLVCIIRQEGFYLITARFFIPFLMIFTTSFHRASQMNSIIYWPAGRFQSLGAKSPSFNLCLVTFFFSCNLNFMTSQSWYASGSGFTAPFVRLAMPLTYFNFLFIILSSICNTKMRDIHSTLTGEVVPCCLE